MRYQILICVSAAYYLDAFVSVWSNTDRQCGRKAQVSLHWHNTRYAVNICLLKQQPHLIFHTLSGVGGGGRRYGWVITVLWWRWWGKGECQPDGQRCWRYGGAGRRVLVAPLIHISWLCLWGLAHKPIVNALIPFYLKSWPWPTLIAFTIVSCSFPPKKQLRLVYRKIMNPMSRFWQDKTIC